MKQVLLSPVLMRRFNAFATCFWIVMIPISIYMGWVTSVTYVSALSLWALVSGHLSAWQSARTEVAQERAERAKEQEDIAKDVTDRIVRDTEIERPGR
jgi:hypothetical protein